MKFLRRTAHVVSILAPLLLVASVASSQPPAPRTPVKRNPPQQPASNDKREATKDRGSANDPFIVKVLPAPKTPQETANDQQAREDQSAANWWMVRLTGLLILVGIVQAVVFWIQARRLKETVDKMDEIAKGQAEDIKKSLAESARAATAMEGMAEIAKTNTGVAVTHVQMADRPWLSVRLEILNQMKIAKSGFGVRVRVIITNVGRSAAQYVRFGIDIVEDENTIKPMTEITRVMQAIPTNSYGDVILPSQELRRELSLHIGPSEDRQNALPTIYGGVRYTHGQSLAGPKILSETHNTTFGFKVVSSTGTAGRLPVSPDNPEECWIYDPAVETSVRDFNYAD